MCAGMVDLGIGRDSQDIVRETDKAICIHVRTAHVGQPRPVWLPKSQIAWKSDAGFAETLRVKAWLARENHIA